MIENYGQNLSNTNTNNTNAPEQRKVLRMVKNERMAGYVPSWETPKTAKGQIANQMASADIHGAHTQSFDNALALHSQESRSIQNPEEFGFGDLIDMVNPLHHIPIVGSVYREVTGDQIKPIGKIIGGGIFGGGVGAASGLVNTIVEAETGKDLTGNAASMVMEGKMPKLKSVTDNPEARLNAAAQNKSKDLPASLLSFTDTNYKPPHNLDINNIDNADDIIAGLPNREPISHVHIQQKVPFKEL